MSCFIPRFTYGEKEEPVFVCNSSESKNALAIFESSLQRLKDESNFEFGQGSNDREGENDAAGGDQNDRLHVKRDPMVESPMKMYRKRTKDRQRNFAVLGFMEETIVVLIIRRNKGKMKKRETDLQQDKTESRPKRETSPIVQQRPKPPVFDDLKSDNDDSPEKDAADADMMLRAYIPYWKQVKRNANRESRMAYKEYHKSFEALKTMYIPSQGKN